MDRRHQIIRMWIACLVAVAWWCVSPTPELPVILFGAGIGFMPGCGCYCAGPACEWCSAISGSYQVDLSGYANGGACVTCATYNDSFVLTPVANDCSFSFEITSGTCTVPGVPSFDADDVVMYFEDGGGGNTEMDVYVGAIESGQALTIWEGNHVGTTPFDCTSLSGETSARTSHAAFTCTHDGSVATVTAI
jgi:hypothetical protein